MTLCKVVGTVVATRKDEKLTGSKLLVVQEIDLDCNPKDRFYIAVDSVGAGTGEVVLIATGSSARYTAVTRDKPVDAAIIAIVDIIEVGGQVKYRKGQSA
ncbi:ethanolamine utilization protein EutN [Candidatus Poribacteria bacterium]|mgnify:FL=1|nr:MAG: ethanolamine utilization protein EutN [Candidatus Poribacteria bacterium]